MTFKKLQTYVLPGENSTAQVKTGEVVVSKGSNATALRFKVRAQLKNTGTARALTAAERAAFLDTFDHTLRWGAALQHKPRSNVGFQRERTLVRQMLGSELEGIDNATSGLARSIGSSAVTVEWFQRIYLCGAWKDSESDADWGVGPSQAASIQVQLRRNLAVLPAGFALEGDVTLDLIPDEFPSKYDRVTPIPHWHTFTEANRSAKFEPGLPLYIVERSAAHASSVLTDVSFRVDGLELYSKVSLQEVVSKWLDTPGYWAENQTFDVDTVLHLLLPGQRLRDWPTGTATVEQDTRTLATFQLGQLYVPVKTEAETERDVAHFATAKGKRISAVMLPALLGKEVPANLLPFMPYALVDEGDSEFDRFAGLMCAPKEEPRIYFPAALAARAKSRASLHMRARETLAAEKTVREFAGTVPGAVQDPRGFGNKSSRYLEMARAALTR